jgi:crotonobetainyl-CoA:carnitine CoA-transferase CaiB-like acyl-CoA transferase
MERSELASDPRFRTNADRVKRQEELFEIVQGWLTSMPSDEAIMAKLNQHRVPAAPVLSVEEAINHPHLRARGTIARVHDKVLGDIELPGFPLRFSAFPDGLDLEAPLLGEHNEDVLGRYLGYTPERIQELEHAGILYSKQV